MPRGGEAQKRSQSRPPRPSNLRTLRGGALLVVRRRGDGGLRVQERGLGLLAGRALDAARKEQVALAQLAVHGGLVLEARVGPCRRRRGVGGRGSGKGCHSQGGRGMWEGGLWCRSSDRSRRCRGATVRRRDGSGDGDDAVQQKRPPGGNQNASAVRLARVCAAWRTVPRSGRDRMHGRASPHIRARTRDADARTRGSAASLSAHA